MRSTSNSTRKRPPHIEEQVWTAWSAIWSSEDFKNKSKQNKRNRRKGVADGQPLPTHNGGSATHEQIAIDLEKQLGEPPSLYDLFMYTHTKNHDGKTFLNDKAKHVHEFFASRRADLELIGEEFDENELFYSAIGGHDRKKRIYGLGSYGQTFFPTNSSETSTSQSTNSEKHQLEMKIQKLEEIVEQQRIDLNDVRSIMDEMRSKDNE